MSNDNLIETDVLVIGAGPAGLAFSIHYANLIGKHNIPLKVMILEKAATAGNHTLSGAVMNLKTLGELLPEVDLKGIPSITEVKQEDILFLTKSNAFGLPYHPKVMSNKGNHILSLGAMVGWLGGLAEQKGVEIFAGVAGYELIFENGKLVGVFTGASGLDHEGKPMSNYQPPTEVRAKIVVLAEGARGHLTKQLIDKFNLTQDKNPQVYSLGVKEVWEVPEGSFAQGRIMHTLGFPLGADQFGGGFVYGLNKTQVVIGFCSGLDYSNPAFDPHRALQQYKQHPQIAEIIKNGKLIKYGAKNIPEGGLFSWPQLYHDNFMIIGDSAGFVAMPSLKGIHLSIKAAMTAAQAAFEAIKAQDTSKERLSLYEKLFKDTPEYSEMYAARNFRQCFTSNLYLGFLKYGINLITGGRGLSLNGKSRLEADYKHCRPALKGRQLSPMVFDNKTTFDKEADVFYSGTKHDEAQPCHILISSAQVCRDCIEKFEAPCQHFCPARVFELSPEAQGNPAKIILHPSNCIHCKTCDIKDPFQNVTWMPPYGADGPKYENM
ncbi:MAG: 4Fe-4S dicluster domain-containing protein [Candidatus Omnitrophica bacterium]|nr:4Fe-4S dicluster domain-containing protein [Candidatus Omnitrophota bacterium]